MAKVIRDQKPEPNNLDPYPTLSWTKLEICSAQSELETRVVLNRTISELKFSTKLFIFAWQVYWIKNQLI